MLNIKIAKDIRIISDDKNYILQVKNILNKDWKGKKKGELTDWKDFGYFQDWEYLMEEILHLKIKRSYAKKLEDIVEIVKSFKTPNIK